MAERKIPYIIELMADDKKLRQQMSGWNWEDIMGQSKGKGFKDTLVRDTKEAKQEIVATLGGMSLDWGKILGEKELGLLEKKIAKVITANTEKLKVFGRDNDTTGIQNTIELVSALGDELKALGSGFDAASLARNLGSFMKVLTPLSAKIEQLAKEPEKVAAAFDRMVGSVSKSTQSNNIGQFFEASGKIKVAMQGLKATNEEINEATTNLEKYKNVVAKLSGDNPATIKLAKDLEGLNKQLDEQMQKEEQLAAQGKTNNAQYAAALKNIMAIENARLKMKAKPTQNYVGEPISQDFDYYEKKINTVIEKASKKISELEGKLASTIDRSFAEVISKQISDIKLSVSLSEQSQTQFVNEINTFVKKINQTPLEKVKLGMEKVLDNSPTIIEDESKRAYKDKPADDDVNTTKMVTQTENRFDRIATAIQKKQTQILNDTKTWRKDMLDQFKFKSGDFEFKFNDTLTEELQSLFDDYALKVNIDPTYLADQIKTVLNNSDGAINGGTASIDTGSMASAIAMGLRAALTGEIPQVAITSNASSASEDVPQQVEHIATEIQRSGKHLDLAEDYVKDVVEKLKAVAKYAAKDSKGSIATLNRFDSLGIDLHKVKNAGDVGNDAEIVSLIENSLLQKDEFGRLKGSTVIDELSKFKGSSSKTIPAFLTSMDEVFFMLQENTQTVEEWTRRRHNKEIFDSARGQAKAASGLRDVRSTIRQGEIPNIESIETAISLMATIGRNTDDLQALKSAREALSDKTDDASIEEFKTAADVFYKSSTKTFWDLKKQAEDTFKGTVYLQGKNGKTSSKNIDSYKQLANIKDDAVIVDVEVSSSLNNVALGTVKSKYKNTASQAEEKRLIKDATRPDFIIPRRYEKDILNKELTYQGFKPQNISSTEVDLDTTIKGKVASIAKSENTISELQNNITLLEQDIKNKQTEVEALKRTLELIGVEPAYEMHATDDYGKKFDTLYYLNRNSKVTGESNLPKEGYSTEIAEAINKKTALNDRLAKLSEQARIVESLTVEQAKKRLQTLSESLVPDEEMALYQKFIDNPIDSRLLKGSKNIPGYSQDEVKKIKSISKKDMEMLLNRGKSQRENIDLYSRFIQNPDDVRNNILSSIQHITQESATNQKSLDSYIVAWAKSEEEKIPEAEAILKQAAEKVLSKIGSTMNTLYKDMIATEGKLKGNISEEERTVLTARMQDLFNAFSQAQEEYDNLVHQNKITRKKPLGADRLKDITTLQQQYSGSVRKDLSGAMSSTTAEIAELNAQKLRLRQQKSEATSQLKHNESLIQRAEAEREYNKLLEKSLMLHGSIEKMTADEADEKALKRKQKELDKINAKLAEAEAKVQALGGFLGQGDVKEYSDSERKTYALDELKKIEDDLITARAQKRVSESRISKKDKEIADLDKWGLGAGIGASELANTKGRLTSEFMSGDYVQSQVNALREKAKTAIAETENESRKIFDKKVATAMEHLNWNPLDQTQVQKFLNTKHGQQLSSDFASEVDANTSSIWKQYDVFRKDLLSKLKTEFQDSFKTDKGVLTATSKVQDETGQWVNEIVEVRVKDVLRARLEEEKRILEEKHTPIQSNIDRLEADKAVAIEYGGVSEKELLSGKIIEDQINKEIELTKWREKQIAAQEKLNELEIANVDHSDQIYRDTKKDLNEATKQVDWYELLVKNRQKLAQMRYDESKEPTYTDEEKELHFTNQIISYNEKIENSLVKQKALKEQIASATGDDKTKLERQLSIEEANVAKWREKIPTFENKLNRLQTSKAQGVTSAILPEGGIVGSIVSAVREVVGTGVDINTEELAKEATLQAILQVLGGVPTGDDGYGLGRRKKKEAETTQPNWIDKMSEEERKAAVAYINGYDKEQMNQWKQMNATELVGVIQNTTQTMDGLNKESVEYLQKQRELGNLLNIYKEKSDVKDQATVTRKDGKTYVDPKKLAQEDSLLKSLGLYDKYIPITGNRAVRDMFAMPKQEVIGKPEVKEAEATLQIKDFDEFKLQAQALKQVIEAQVVGSEEQKQFQAALVQLLQAWARNEASGFDGKLPGSEGWKAYLTQTGVFDNIDTSITPLTNRQLNKEPKAKDVVVEKPTQKKESKKTETRTESRQPTTQQATGGLIQLVSRLATEATLLQVLGALQTVGTTKGGQTAPTAAGDLYEQFKALLLGSSVDDHERLALMNSEAGVISGSVIGNIANISEELMNALRAKYPNAKGFDTQIHTHGKDTGSYFSIEDYQQFSKDYEAGIKKQVLLTQDHVSVLDLSAVKSAEEVKALMNELVKAGNDAEAVRKVLEGNKSGAIFETAKFDSLNADSLVNMIGASGVGSNAVAGLDTIISKMQDAKKKMQEAVNIGYLSDKDTNVAEFDTILNKIKAISEGIKNGTTSYEAQKAELDKLVGSATRYSDVIGTTIRGNKRAYSGTSEVNSVNNQRNKILNMFESEEDFNTSDIALVQAYNKAVQDLNTTYQTLANNRQLQDEQEQRRLSQQASKIQAMGKHLIANINQARQLEQYVAQSGTYMKGEEVVDLGGKSGKLSVDEVKSLESTMRNYVQNTLKQANIENVKFNSTKQQLIYTFRTSKDTVADMVVQYDKATNALYAYNKQERESLTGMKGFIQGFKSKLTSITQYIASITSITRVWSELRQGVQYVREIDSALTELKKVTDETEESYDRFLDTASKTASKVGSTVKDIVNSTTDWARLGYSMEQAHELAASTSVLLNVSEFKSIDEATSALISTMQAFGYAADESMHVVDVMNIIGKNMLPKLYSNI